MLACRSKSGHLKEVCDGALVLDESGMAEFVCTMGMEKSRNIGKTGLNIRNGAVYRPSLLRLRAPSLAPRPQLRQVLQMSASSEDYSPNCFDECRPLTTREGDTAEGCTQKSASEIIPLAISGARRTWP